jgi:hypothetical protein
MPSASEANMPVSAYTAPNWLHVTKPMSEEEDGGLKRRFRESIHLYACACHVQDVSHSVRRDTAAVSVDLLNDAAVLRAATFKRTLATKRRKLGSERRDTPQE